MAGNGGACGVEGVELIRCGPRTSTGLPLDRMPRACFATVTSKLALASQYADVAPAIPAPEINAFRIGRA